MKLYARYFALVLWSVLFAHSVDAQTRRQTVALRVTLENRFLVFENNSTNDASDCSLIGYASTSQSAMFPPFRRATRIFQVNAPDPHTVLRVRPPVFRARGRSVRSMPMYFRTSLRCSGVATYSRISRANIRVSTRATIRSGAAWGQAVRRGMRLMELALNPVTPSARFTQPVDIQFAAGDSRMFVVEQPGIIRSLPLGNAAGAASEFLDITTKVESGGERGLLGLAFSPQYATDRQFFVHYSEKTTGDTIIARYVATTDGLAGDPTSEQILFEFPQPAANHNGGQIAFGPDGYLYISLGDGGGGGDPFENAQDLSTPLGKILRIDVSNQDPGLQYAIPTDNPFQGAGERPEIFAYGLRNAWRMSFDRQTGALWAGDVGQNRFEEVNLITRGGNFGWDVLEGVECYEPSSGCSSTGTTLPVHVYSHAVGNSITGGYVHRAANPLLRGQYFFADFVSGRIWSLHTSRPRWASSLHLESEQLFSTFGQDAAGDVYVASYVSGEIFKLSSSERAIARR